MVDNKKLQNEICKILDKKEVDYVISYRKGSYGFKTTPFFISKKEDADKAIFSPFCINNLSIYIKDIGIKNKIGIVAKGCESRALIEIINEKRIPREKLFVIGISCKGVIDPKKINKKITESLENIKAIEKDDNFIFNIDGKRKVIPKSEIVFDKCKTCEYPTPLIYDVLVGDKIKPLGKKDYSIVKDFESKSIDDKWEFWEDEFERCIRCYACRNICPACYCEECIAEKLDPKFLRRSVNISENAVWHIIRAFHLAGRCTSCGECERVCPMDISLMLLNKKVEKDVKKLFDYAAGEKLEEKPLLSLFNPDDPEEDIK